MKLLFITGNKHKLKEAKEILGDMVESKDLDLAEIQSLDPKEIIREKLEEARKLITTDAVLMVEDVSAYAGETGLPGPFVKFFNQTLGREGMVKFCRAFDTDTWVVHCHVGLLMPDKEEPVFLTATVEGKVVDPRGESGFCFDPIFVPNGYEKTYAEMNQEEKNSISHRKIALEKVKAFLETSKRLSRK